MGNMALNANNPLNTAALQTHLALQMHLADSTLQMHLADCTKLYDSIESYNLSMKNIFQLF